MRSRLLTDAEIDALVEDIREDEPLWNLLLQKEIELREAQGGDPDNVKVELPMPTGMMILQEHLLNLFGDPIPSNYTLLYIRLRRRFSSALTNNE